MTPTNYLVGQVRDDLIRLAVNKLAEATETANDDQLEPLAKAIMAIETARKHLADVIREGQ